MINMKIFWSIVCCVFSVLVAVPSGVLAKEVSGSAQAEEAAVSYIEGERPLMDKKVQVLRLSALVSVRNDLGVLYVDQDKVMFRLADKNVVLDELKGAEGLWLESRGKYVYAFWWVKFIYKEGEEAPVAGKTLFVRASDDYGQTFSPRAALNQAGGILPDLSMAHDNQGNISVMWKDERDGGYEMYVNSSQNGGKTWLKDGQRLDKPRFENLEKKEDGSGADVKTAAASSPHIGYVGNKLVATWQQLDWVSGKNILRFISRDSQDHGVTWNAESDVAELDHSTHVETNFYSAGDEVFLAISRASSGLVLYSTIDAKVWRELGVVPGTEELDIASLVRMAANDELLLISYTGVPKTKLWRVEAVSYDRKSKQWLEGVHRVDGLKEGEVYPRTSQQALALLDNGSFCMAWEGTQAIMPSVYFDCTKDGVNWFKDGAAPLTIPGYSHDSGVALVKGENKLWVFYSHVIPNGNKSSAVATMQELVLNAEGEPVLPKRVFKRFSDKERMSLLDKRIKTFWDTRIEGDLEAVWTGFDPVYRMKMSKYKWMSMQENIAYFKYSVLNDGPITINGNFARVDVEIEVTARPAVVEEGFVEASVPKKAKASQLWGWFYDDWYLVPEGIFGNHLD